MGTFELLPRELLEDIFDNIRSRRRRILLSCTCKRFRAALIPRIFRIIHFSNAEESTACAWAIATTFGVHVEELRFKGVRHDRVYREVPVSHGDLPDVAAELLAGGPGLLPNVKTVAVRFDFGVENGRERDVAFSNFDVIPDDLNTRTGEQIPTAESPRGEDYAWRRLMAQTYRAIARNPTISHLKLEGLIPMPTSTFLDPDWHDFLSRLDHLTITLLGMEDIRTSTMGNTLPGVADFVRNMRRYFFDHMPNLKSLAFSGEDELPIGLNGEFYMPLPFPDTSMPALEQLTLRKILPGEELLAFLEGKNRLTSLALEDVKVILPDTSFCFGNITWAQFFDGLSALGLPLLREVRVHWPDGVPLNENEPPELWETEDIDKVLDELKVSPAKKVFPYSMVDARDGRWTDIPEANIESFWIGEDQKAYDNLMTVLEENRRARR